MPSPNWRFATFDTVLPDTTAGQSDDRQPSLMWHEQAQASAGHDLPSDELRAQRPQQG